MYSNSSSFIGGGNSGRPGPSQYGQQSFSSQQLQPTLQQPSSVSQQFTGMPGTALQNQYTGLPGGGQPQGFPSVQQQVQSPNYPPSQPSFQAQPPQPMQSPNAAPALAPARTGFTSSQIAQSFQAAEPAPAPPAQSTTAGVKIPKIRLSFLTAQDQAKFEQLFKSAVGHGQALDGDKVRDLLVRSKLPGSDLMHIWVLSDTTKSGQLLFPEFAVAMYLCNLKLVGKPLPQALPETIANEVSSMVDIISFGVPDDRPQAPPRSNAPNFASPSQFTPALQQPQPQATNSQLLNQLTTQPTGFASQYIPPQNTGFQPPATGFAPQPTGNYQNQGTFPQNPQPAGYLGPRPPMPPMPAGLGANITQGQMGNAPQPLNAQPTGRPGQWGLVNTPASGLPNIEALQQQMMPQPGPEGGYTTAGLSGSATVPWAVTKDEKKIYDQLFKAWDGFYKGFIGGDVAIKVMGQSGLEKTELEKIWTLSDPGNKGRLDMDEFAVAMHLIYRKLHGYPVPNRLPPELIPPSTRNFADSIGTVKSLLSRDAESRKNSGAFLQPPKTGVSYLKNHSFRGDSSSSGRRKDATVFRNNDDDVGYKSSARRRLGGDGRTPSPAPSSQSSDISNDEISIEQLRKQVKEKQVLLDAIDFKDDNDADEDSALDRRDRKEAEELYLRIRHAQEEIDANTGASLRGVDSGAERRALKRQLQTLIDRLPDVASRVRRCERAIADTQLEAFRLKDAKDHPNSAAAIVGTGPGGSVTEVDKIKARAKARMQQRAAALTGKAVASDMDDASSVAKRLEAESLRVRTETENNERMIKDVEDSVRDFAQGLEDSLTEAAQNPQSEHEKRRWEEGLGVEEGVRDFIFDLQRSSRAARVRSQNTSVARTDPLTGSSLSRRSTEDASFGKEGGAQSARENALKSLPSSTSDNASYSSYRTAEERAAFVKQQAEERLAKRLAALGLKPPSKSGESLQQKQEREAKERDERVRQAQVEDAKRDEERQRRLAEEQPSPPAISKPASKKPPPPPSRKVRGDSLDQQAESKRKADAEAVKNQEAAEQAIRAKQAAQETETRRLEEEAARQEAELAREREAAQSRLKALEEQYQAGKIKKQEEKRKKQTAEKAAQEKEARLVAQRAELEAAKEKERQLQLQLESLRDDDSSDEDPTKDGITPQESTPTTSQILRSSSSERSHDAEAAAMPASPPPSVPVAAPPPAYSTETKNPFFKKLSQPNEPATPTASQSTSSITSPSVGPSEVSTNPFHRLTIQENSAKAVAAPLAPNFTGTRPSRVRPEEDEWSIVDSNGNSSDDDDDERPQVGSAKQLASMLFGTMGPPRPSSATDEKKVDRASTPTILSPGLHNSSSEMPSSAPAPPPTFDDNTVPSAPPPPPPPMPGSFGGAPSAPPPPPPPPPSSAAPGSAGPKPPAVGALLGEIVKGKGLKKVETKDRSQASVAGRVLN